MSTNRPRVLIIDDDPLYRSLITTLLRKDYLLAVAADGAEGYQKALQHPPDIAIVDVQMQGWGGLKTLEEFRKHPILKRVKFVMLSSDASKESVIAAIKGGANDYVIKTSFSREEFLGKLRRLTNQPVINAMHRPTQANPHQKQVAAAQNASESSQAKTNHNGNGENPEPLDESDLQGIMDCWD